MKAVAMDAVQIRRHRWAVALRVLVASVGGYALSALGCAVLAHALVAFGLMERASAVLLSTLLSFVIYTVLVLWAFHVRSLAWVCFVWALSGCVLGAALVLLRALS